MVNFNAIALVCELLSVDGLRLEIGEIDAFDGSPVIDIKCYIDAGMPRDGSRSPKWER